MAANTMREASLHSFWVEYIGLRNIVSRWATYDQVLDYTRKRHALGEAPREPVLHVFSFKGYARAARAVEPNADFDTIKAEIETNGYELFDSKELATRAGNEVVQLAVRVLSEVYGQNWQSLIKY